MKQAVAAPNVQPTHHQTPGQGSADRAAQLLESRVRDRLRNSCNNGVIEGSSQNNGLFIEIKLSELYGSNKFRQLRSLVSNGSPLEDIANWLMRSPHSRLELFRRQSTHRYAQIAPYGYCGWLLLLLLYYPELGSIYDNNCPDMANPNIRRLMVNMLRVFAANVIDIDVTAINNRIAALNRLQRHIETESPATNALSDTSLWCPTTFLVRFDLTYCCPEARCGLNRLLVGIVRGGLMVVVAVVKATDARDRNG